MTQLLRLQILDIKLFYFHYSVFLYFYKEKNEITLTLYLVADVILLSKALFPKLLQWSCSVAAEDWGWAVWAAPTGENIFDWLNVEQSADGF